MTPLFDQDRPPVQRGVVGRPVGRGRPPGRGRRVAVILGVATLVVVLVFGGVGLWFQRKVNPGGSPGEAMSFTVPEGASTSMIAERLDEEGIVSDGRIFRYYLSLQGGGPFQAGEYTLREGSAMGDVVDTLGEGPVQTFQRFTVPEGLTLEEVGSKVSDLDGFSAERFAEAAEAGRVESRFQPADKSLEGLVFPDTYRVEADEDEADVLARMVATFDEVASELGYEQAMASNGRSPYETLIVASLVEAEAKVPEERPRIARVIYNRLEAGMPLGIDATVYYALGRRGGSLTLSDLAVDSPYNTRKVAGLPPTPISNAGRASLEAALDPEPGPWLYYVLSDEDGRHAFSDNIDQFNRDKAEAQRRGLIP